MLPERIALKNKYVKINGEFSTLKKTKEKDFFGVLAKKRRNEKENQGQMIKSDQTDKMTRYRTRDDYLQKKSIDRRC